MSTSKRGWFVPLVMGAVLATLLPGCFRPRPIERHEERREDRKEERKDDRQERRN